MGAGASAGLAAATQAASPDELKAALSALTVEDRAKLASALLQQNSTKAAKMMSPLRSFLVRSRQALSDALASSPTIFVMGNTSCDLDSITSAVGYAAFRSTSAGSSGSSPDTCAASGSPIFVPVVNIPKKTFPSLLQQAWFLAEYFGVTADDLIFWEDVKDRLSPSSQFFLVDHNEVDATQRDLLTGKVIGCLDHHELSDRFHGLLAKSVDDKRNPCLIYPPSKFNASAPSEDAPLVGSTASIITAEMLKVPDLGGVTPKTINECPLLNDVLQLLHGAVISDTRNFSDQTVNVKWSVDYDKKHYDASVRQLENNALKQEKLLSGDAIAQLPSGDVVADLLFKIKFDVKRNLDLGVVEVLGTDYKAFKYGPAGEELSVGYASLAVNLSMFLKRFTEDEMAEGIAQFMVAKRISVLLLMSGNLQNEKEMGLAYNGGLLNAEARAGLVEKLTAGCSLVHYKSKNAEVVMFDFYHQKNIKMSRKQVEPLVKAFITGLDIF